jgi:hypothetical protein
MEFAGFFIVLIVFAVLATLFGADSREELPSAEHRLARLGLDWTETPARPAFPTLTAIDRLRGGTAVPFAAAPNAAALEARAQALTGSFWSDTTWLTGAVPASALERVAAELERLRDAAPVANLPPLPAAA